jgi:predicted negative regulator of RcsB-dependent stress response
VDDLLTDQQQADIARKWLKDNGLWLAAGVVLGIAGLFGWFQWQDYELRRAEEASALFEEFRAAAAQPGIEGAELHMRSLSSDFAGSGYTDQARLIMARLYLDRSDPDKAADYLRQVATGAASEEIRLLATLRYARLLVFREQAEDAVKALAISVPPAWGAAFHAVRGDAYYALGKRNEARSEYEQALKAEETPGLDRGYIQAKLDDLGGPTTAPAAAPAP